MNFDLIEKNDKELFDAMMEEKERQNINIELIASENFVSDDVLQAMGSHLTNKYAEGYPGKRYYGGCEFVDKVENLARDRAKKIFGADHANVQPHSGSNANFGVYFSVLKPGDKILGMDLSMGGHLTHGSPVNMSGSYFNVVFYGVDKETETIDYDKVREDDTFNFVDLASFAPDKQLTLELAHADGTKEQIKLNHTYNQQQIDWFRAGSALNLIKLQANS